MPHPDSLIVVLVAAFVLAFVFGMLAHRFKLSPIVGYLAAGVVVGPFTPGLIADAGVVSQLAEIGVILLMFGVGLHFSPQDLMRVRRAAVPGAFIQIVLATVLGWGLGRLLGSSDLEGALLGFCLSIASTVVVLRTLEERRQLKGEVGRIAVGWLVVQDLVVVLALVLLPLLVTQSATSAAGLASQVGWRLLKVGAFVAIMLLVGGRVLPWLLVRIAHTHSRELFTLGVLAIALGIAYVAFAAFGASFALGAFVAGLVLNGTPLGHKAAERSLPFRDAFAVLFFVSAGMLFDPRILAAQPVAVLGVLAIVTVSGAVAALIVARVSRLDGAQRNLLAASLVQIGEFSFVLAGLAVAAGAMAAATYGLIVAGAILSIAVNPVALWVAGWVADRVALDTPQPQAAETVA